MDDDRGGSETQMGQQPGSEPTKMDDMSVQFTLLQSVGEVAGAPGRGPRFADSPSTGIPGGPNRGAPAALGSGTAVGSMS